MTVLKFKHFFRLFKPNEPPTPHYQKKEKTGSLQENFRNVNKIKSPQNSNVQKKIKKKKERKKDK